MHALHSGYIACIAFRLHCMHCNPVTLHALHSGYIACCCITVTLGSVNSRLQVLGGTHIWGVYLMHFLTFFIFWVFFWGGIWDSGIPPPPQEIAGNNTVH